MAAFAYEDIEKHNSIYMIKLFNDIKEGKQILLSTKERIVVQYDKTIQTLHSFLERNRIKDLARNLKGSPVFKDKDGIAHLLTKIEKTPYSIGDKNTPTTQEQEIITAEIFKLLMSKSTPDYKTFEEALPVLNKVCKFDILSSNDWYNSFKVQFNFIRDDKRIPNSKYDEYNRDGGFMDYITNYVKTNFNINKKDAWNPADIWLIDNSIAKNYMKKMESMASPKTNDINNPEELNALLREAFNDKAIVGISLKKNNGKQAHYELVNLQLSTKKFKGMEFISYDIDTSFDSRKKEFKKVSSYFKVKFDGVPYDCNIRRSSGTTIAKNVYEFSGKNQAAQLGKVPVDYLLRYLRLHTKSNVNVPDPNGLPKTLVDLIKDKNLWISRLKDIKSCKHINNYDKSSAEEIFENMIKSYKSNDNFDSTMSSVFQIIHFAHHLTKIKDIEAFSTDIFYASQKKGKEFGPFGKLY